MAYSSPHANSGKPSSIITSCCVFYSSSFKCTYTIIITLKSVKNVKLENLLPNFKTSLHKNLF